MGVILKMTVWSGYYTSGMVHKACLTEHLLQYESHFRVNFDLEKIKSILNHEFCVNNYGYNIFLVNKYL